MAKIKEGYSLLILCPGGSQMGTLPCLDGLDLEKSESQELLAHTIREALPKKAFEKDEGKLLEACKWAKVYIFQAMASNQKWWNEERARENLQAAYDRLEQAITEAEAK